MVRLDNGNMAIGKKIRYGCVFVACLLIFAVVLLFAGPMKAEDRALGAVLEETERYLETEVAMDASYGFDNMAKGGRYLPVYMTLENQSEEPFYGDIRVVSMESDYNIYQYEFPVSLEGGEFSQKNLNIPLGVKTDQLYVCLYDNKGDMVMRKRLKLNTREDIPELLIGVISDSQDRLQYFDDVGVSYSTLRTRLCSMVAGSVPTQAAGLDQLDILLISNYDVRRLSEDQLATIKEWVNRGGVLLLGTGSRGPDSVLEFLDGDLKTEPQELGTISVNMGEGYLFTGTGSSYLDLYCNDISLREGTVLFESDGIPLITTVTQESGMIAVAAFDFADLDEFCFENPSYVDDMLTKLLGDARITRLSDYLYSGTSKAYWAVQGILGGGNVDKLPQIGMYAVVLISYILLAGPGLYFFLKHREIRQYYRGGVVLLSLLCTGIVYGMSGDTRFTNTFFNYATIQDVSDSVVTESTFISMQAPDDRPYTVALDPSYTVRPITRSAYYDSEQVPRFNGEETPNITIRYKEDATELRAQNIASFSPSYFALEKRLDGTGEAPIQGKISYFENQISGSITNNMDCKIENTAVLLYGSLVLVGDIEPGETVTLESEAAIRYPTDANLAGDTAELITGSSQYEQADIANREYLETLARTSLLEYYLAEYLTGYQPGARIVAFRDVERDNTFLLDDQYEVSGLTMYTAAAESDMSRGELVYRPSVTRPPTVINGTYQAAANTISGITPVTLEYSLGSELEIETLTLETLSQVFTENDGVAGLRLFEGGIYFYNYQEGDYDLMDSRQTKYEASELEPYLSPGNTITVRYVCDSPEEFGNVALPILSVTGRERNAEN